MRVQDGAPLPSSFPTTVTGGLIGLVTTAGVYSTSIRVTDSALNVFDRPIAVTVSPLRIISPYQWPKATAGTPYSHTLASYGGSGTYTYSSSNLPPGLVVSSAGVISGTPGTAGTYNFNVAVSDPTTSNTVSLGFQLVVDPYAITTGGQLARGTVNSAYSQTLSAAGCGTSCTWSVTSGGLPGGLALSTAGVVSGSPTGTYNGNFTAQVSGSAGTVQKVFWLQVAAATPQPLYINNGASMGYIAVGNGQTTYLNAQGGTPPYAWSLAAGSLPPGIRLAGPGETLGATLAPGGTYLQGTAMQAGSYSFTLKVTDGATNTYSRAFTLNVFSVIGLDNTSLPFPGTMLLHGTAYSQALVALGGSGSYPSWSDMTDHRRQGWRSERGRELSAARRPLRAR